ncbi:MAG TPA: polysaccharide lyase family protein [Terracidiphilus sp.]|nr:polysaccharide lyase family protein [Terracidiphilus sp.]
MKDFLKFRTLILFTTAIACAQFSSAQQQVVWRIGQFNDSSGEFARNGIDYSNPTSDVDYIVGKSRDKDWHAFQPGPANGMAGARQHPYTIHFTLTRPPRGEYALHLAILYETPRLSYLNLKINGHEGDVYFHPTLDFEAGDWEGTFVPQTSRDEKSVWIPARFLHEGKNTLILTAIDDPAKPENSSGAIAPGHTGITYDALELLHSDKEENTKQLQVRITPEIFYHSQGSELTEEVTIVATRATVHRGDSAQLIVNDHSETLTVDRNRDFGELCLQFRIPEWKGKATAHFELNGQRSANVSITPAKKWTIAIIPHEHLDVGFTDYAAKVAELHSQSIDQAMDLMRVHPEFRWTLDGSWVADMYLRGRDKQARDEFLAHVRDSSIVIPPEFANQHTGNASLEGLARSFYDRERLARKYHLAPIDAAQIVDVPSYTWAYASVLHDAGIKYLLAASNSWRAPVMLLGRWNEKSPFYWEGPDGGRVLMWYARAYLQAHTLFGGPWRMAAIHDSLPVFLQAYTRPDYTANTVIIFGSQLENTALDKAQSTIVADFSAAYAWPRLEFSTVASAMHQVESEWKGNIPIYRGDFGPYWEDGYGSDAKHTAIHRANQNRIQTAEILGSVVHALDPRVTPDKHMLKDAWWNELLYDEHTWTYVSSTTDATNEQSITQLALKQSRVVRAENDLSESVEREWAQLEALVKPHDTSIAVFNSLNWPRGGFVEVNLPDNVALVDSTSKKEVPLETIATGKGIAIPGFGAPTRRVRFFADNIPAVGYKLFTLVPSTASPQPAPAHAAQSIENRFYRISFDPKTGAIRSIYDKDLGRELVEHASPYAFGSYLYVTGADNYPNNSLYRFGAGLKPPVLAVHPQQRTHAPEIRSNSLGVEAITHAHNEQTPEIETRVFLPANEKLIFLSVSLHKDATLHRESAYIAFPFAVQNPRFGYGSQSAWVDPAKDELAGGSREWYLASKWAAVHNNTVSATVIPLDAPLVNFGDIVRGNWPAQFHPKSSTIFSWLMNNYWATNFPASQGGEFTFRYAITSTKSFDPSTLTALAENQLTPLEHDSIAGSLGLEPSLLPATSASLLDIGSPNVTLLTWKQAEDGDGSILRLQEHSGKETDVPIASAYLKFERVTQTDLLERNQSAIATNDGRFSITLHPYQVVTLRVHAQSNLEEAK